MASGVERIIFDGLRRTLDAGEICGRAEDWESTPSGVTLRYRYSANGFETDSTGGLPANAAATIDDPGTSTATVEATRPDTGANSAKCDNVNDGSPSTNNVNLYWDFSNTVTVCWATVRMNRDITIRGNIMVPFEMQFKQDDHTGSSTADVRNIPWVQDGRLQFRGSGSGIEINSIVSEDTWITLKMWSDVGLATDKCRHWYGDGDTDVGEQDGMSGAALSNIGSVRLMTSTFTNNDDVIGYFDNFRIYTDTGTGMTGETKF